MPMNRAQLRDRYGSFHEVRIGGLDAARVPPELRDLIPYAEVWGVGDDLAREALVEAAPAQARTDLVEIVRGRGEALDRWLAGPEADSRRPTAEYLAFTHLRMARYSL